MPANDASFYDGAVVNFLNGGGYFNPSLALALPISGTEVFCAYPPAYQAVLWAWMSVFGTGEVAAMLLHLVLFGAYLLVLLEIFRRLKTPPLWVNIAGLFLFVITFHDRPDSLAQLFGASAVLAWVRSRDKPTGGGGWAWLATAFVVLALTTSLQLGGVYLCLIGLLSLMALVGRGERIAWVPLLASGLIPVALIALVKFGYPRLWIGFQEHAAQTPAVLGMHWPRFDDLLKVLRTAPGVCGVLALVAGLGLRNRGHVANHLTSVPALVAMGGAAAVAGISVAALVYLSANFAISVGYLQPLIVGGFLTAFGGELVERRQRRFWVVAFVVLAAVGGIRAVGMSTWGVACAADVGHKEAIQRVRVALDSTPSGGRAVVSAAFLYEAARHKEVRAIHSDWLAPGRHPEHLVNLIIQHRPAKLILTQFDYYRHFEGSVGQLQGQSELVEVKINNPITTPVPDASRRWRRVVQHISWSPVIVELTWR